MLVYRICNQNEVDILLNEKSFNNIGKQCKVDNKKNTHKYKESKKYIHFFKEIDSIFYLKTTKNHFICTYEIPEELLIKYKAIGFYLDRMFLRKIDNVIEYALESDLVSFDYLCSIDKIDEDIDFDDCIDGSFYDKVTNIYFKSNETSKKLIL